MGWRVLILQGKPTGGRSETGHLLGDWKIVPPADGSLSHEEARALAEKYGWPNSATVKMEGYDEPSEYSEPDELDTESGGAEQNPVDESHIQRATAMLGAGASVEDVREALLRSGLSEEEVYLAVKAAETHLRMGDGAAECGACEHEDSSVGSISVVDPKTKKQRLFETRGVLAGAYRGKSVSKRELLEHAYEVTQGKWGAEKSLCGKVTADHLSDEDEHAWPSCKECAKKLTKLGASKKTVKENPTRAAEGNGAPLSSSEVTKLPAGSILAVGSPSTGWTFLIVVPGGLAPIYVLPERAGRAPDGEPASQWGNEFILVSEGRGQVPTHGTAQRHAEAWLQARRSGARDNPLVTVEYWVADYHGTIDVNVPDDADDEMIIARAKEQLRRKSGGSLPYGYQRFEIQRDAEENPTHAADYPDIESALQGAQSKFDATHATKYGEAIFSPTSRGYVKRIGFKEKGFYHWPEQGTLVDDLPANVEKIYKLIQVGWDPEAAPERMPESGRRIAAEEARSDLDISQRPLPPQVRTEVLAALARYGASLDEFNRISRGGKILQVKIEARGKRLRMVAVSGQVLSTYPLSQVDRGVSDFVERFWFWKSGEGAAEDRHAEDVVFYKPGDRVLLQRYNRPGTIETVDVDAAGRAKYGVAYTDRSGAKKQVRVAPYEVRPRMLIATEAAGTGVMRARQAVKDAQSALNDAYSRASYAGNTPEMQRKADAEIERCRTALVEAEVALSLTSPRRPMGREVDARENPVEAGNGTSWGKITRDPKAHGAAMARAAEIGPINNGKAVYELLSPELSKEDQEVFLVLPLDIRGQLRCDPIEVHRGARSRVDVSIPDVLRAVIEAGGEGFCVVHNHPTGKADPSKADGDLTKAIRKGAKSVDLAFVDHVVIGSHQYYSFEDKKLYRVKGKKP